MNRTLGLALCVATVLSVGCRPQDEIRAYNTPKEEAPRVQPVANETGAASDRMLAAVLPDGERAWFFKVTGPIGEVDQAAADIEKFFASIRPAADKPHPEWSVPTGWQEVAGSGMRAATILIPIGAKPLDLSVTPLPWRGAPGELLSNVNRWRGQMQLPPVDEAGLAKDVSEISVGDAKLTIVDLRGKFQSGSMNSPFAGGAADGQPPFASPAASAANSNELPAGHPPVAVTANPPTTTSGSTAPFKFDLPEGWQARPAGGMRKVDLLVQQGDKSAVFTAIDFPADSPPMMSDPIANVRRWRGEVGLPPLSDEEIKATMRPVEIDGSRAMFVEAVPDNGQPQAERATMAAMFTRGDSIWFFKLSGDRDAVAAQKDKFERFLKSVRFVADSGGEKDGNE